MILYCKKQKVMKMRSYKMKETATMSADISILKTTASMSTLFHSRRTV
jgi:hypothetical protein